MPEVSRFYGIVVEMFWNEHAPPHFHARYGEQRAVIEIGSGVVIAGELPARARQLLRRWEAQHRAELLANWHRARHRVALERIPPLD